MPYTTTFFQDLGCKCARRELSPTSASRSTLQSIKASFNSVFGFYCCNLSGLVHTRCSHLHCFQRQWEAVKRKKSSNTKKTHHSPPAQQQMLKMMTNWWTKWSILLPEEPDSFSRVGRKTQIKADFHEVDIKTRVKTMLTLVRVWWTRKKKHLLEKKF